MKKYLFWIVYAIFTIVLLVVSAVSLRYVENVLVKYEEAQPEKLVEKYYNEDAFAPKPLEFKVKKESPITKAQKERLTLLLAKHNLEPKCEIASMTRNEASRYMDQILATYGR